MDSALQLGHERGLHMAAFIQKPIRLLELRILLRGLAAKPDSAPPALRGNDRRRVGRGYSTRRVRAALSAFGGSRHIARGRRGGVMRWQHPALGLLSPARFLPLAESTGLIIPLTDWLYGAAIGQAGAWREQGLLLHLSLNLSAKLRFNYDMAGTDRFRLRTSTITRLASWGDTGADGNRGHGRSGPTDRRLTRLRMTGFNLSIDDFGTAYSSPDTIAALAIHRNEGRSIIRPETADSEASRVIVETIIVMAHRPAHEGGCGRR